MRLIIMHTLSLLYCTKFISKNIGNKKYICNFISYSKIVLKYEKALLSSFLIEYNDCVCTDTTNSDSQTSSTKMA